MEPSIYTHHDGDALAGDDITVHEIESALKVVPTYSLTDSLAYSLASSRHLATCYFYTVNIKITT